MTILDYLNDLKERLKKKKLINFWLLVDRDDFKAFKMFSNKLKEYLKDNIQYYTNKRIASVSIYISNDQKSINNKESLVDVRITIFEISELGTLDLKGIVLKISYYEVDLNKKKVSLKDIQKFTKLCADKILLSGAFNGIPYSKLMEKLKDKQIKFDFV